MSKEAFEVVEQFLGGAMSDSAVDRLSNAAVDPEFAETLVAQRTVDQLLRLAASEHEESDFVMDCVDEFRKQFSDEVKIEPRTVAEERPRFNVGRWAAVVVSVLIFAAGVWWSFATKPNGNRIVEDGSSLPVAVKPNGKPGQPTNEIVANPDPVDPEVTPVPNEMPDEQLVSTDPAGRSSDDSSTAVVPKKEVAADPGPPKSTENTELHLPIPEEVVSPKIRLETAPFGRIIASRNAVWSDDPETELVNGTFRLDRGSARLLYDNGVLIRLAGPTEFDLLDSGTIKIREGELLVDIPRKVKAAFCCELGDQKLSNSRNARFFLKVAPDDRWESLLTRGSIDLAKREESESVIELAKSDLFQAAVVPAQEDSDVPATFLARGRKRFFAQCFQGGDEVTFQSPENVQHFLTDVVGNENIGWKRFSKSAGAFNTELAGLQTQATPQQFRSLLANHLQKHFGENNSDLMRDSNQNATTQFRGSLNINGVERHFDSLEEFNRAKNRLIKNGTLDTSPATPESPQVIVVGDQKIEFSTLEMFNQSRRKMNQ